MKVLLAYFHVNGGHTPEVLSTDLKVRTILYSITQPLGFHSNDRFWYRVDTLLEKQRNQETVYH